jgi:hypothetical protein
MGFIVIIEVSGDDPGRQRSSASKSYDWQLERSFIQTKTNGDSVCSFIVMTRSRFPSLLKSLATCQYGLPPLAIV